MGNSHALAASYLLAEDGKTTLHDVEKAVQIERFRARVDKYSFKIPLLKVLVSVFLIVFAGMIIHHDS